MTVLTYQKSRSNLSVTFTTYDFADNIRRAPLQAAVSSAALRHRKISGFPWLSGHSEPVELKNNRWLNEEQQVVEQPP